MLSLIYNVFVQPAQEFRVLAMGPVPKAKLLGWGTLLVASVSAFWVICSPWTSTAGSGLAVKAILGALSGLLGWLLTGGVYATAAYAFGNRGRPQTFLILSALATLPWILLPVVSLFRTSLGPYGQILSGIACATLWIWSSILFLLALKYTYDLTLERVMLAAGLPLLMMTLAALWLGGAFYNVILLFA